MTTGTQMLIYKDLLRAGYSSSEAYHIINRDYTDGELFQAMSNAKQRRERSQNGNNRNAY